MTNHRDDDDNEAKKDLTHIGDLPEFMHEEDPDLDLKFGDLNPNENSLIELDDLDEPVDFDSPPEVPSEILSETNFEISGIDEEEPSAFTTETEDFENQTEESLEFNSSVVEDEIENNLSSDTELDSSNDFFAESTMDSPEEIQSDFQAEPETFDSEESYEPNSSETLIEPKHEKFEDVKNFAQNFSYGTIEGSGNPPFSIIIRNIRFTEEAEDILSLLKEFGIVNESNLKENEQALKMGSILVSQISEFTAIILAHKLRRFDLDIEVGLADAIHPSKSGEVNPRGLTKKEQLKQNKVEEVKISLIPHKIEDIIISNSIHLDGYNTVKVIGLDHAHQFIDEAELDRLTFVDSKLREKNATAEDQKVYIKYKDSFHKIHDELINEIKTRALKEGANALLNVQFTMSSYADHQKNQYQITCSCTKAIITKG